MKKSPSAAHFDWYDRSVPESVITSGQGAEGITTATILYPISIVFFGGMIAFVQGQASTLDLVGWLLAAPIISFIMVFPLSWLLGTVQSVIVPVLNWSLGYTMSARTQIGLGGGMTGFLCTWWVPYAMLMDHQSSVWLGFCAGPILATGLSHYCSLRAARLRVESMPLMFADRLTQPETVLGLRHIFMITAWFAVAFTLARLGGWIFVVVFLVYALQQAAMLGFDQYRYRCSQIVS